MENLDTSLPVSRRRLFNINITNEPEMARYDYHHILPTNRMLALYQTIKHTFPGQACPIIQFASAYTGEGANLIAFETALTAATQIGLRVMFIDTAYQSNQLHPLHLHVDVSLGKLLQIGGQLERSQVGVEDTHFVYTQLCDPQYKDAALANLDSLNDLFGILRGMYDLIVFPSPAILTDILNASLCKLADGTVIVIEAERTRAPVAAQIKETIQQNSGRIIGAIMNKRRYYIPRLLYRWI